MRPSCFRVYVLGEKDRMGSSLAGKPENRSWARLWMKKLNLVATLPRLDSISLERRAVKRKKCGGNQSCETFSNRLFSLRPKAVTKSPQSTIFLQQTRLVLKGQGPHDTVSHVSGVHVAVM